MLKKNSINYAILKFFLLFSLLILGMLWLFQIIFFNSFYKAQKTNDILLVTEKIKKIQNKREFYEEINTLSLDKGVCIEVIDQNYDLIYNSTYFGKGCLSNTQKTSRFKFDFINSNKEEEVFQINNPTFNNDTLIHAIKLQNGKYVFVNSSLEPVDSMVFLIRKQLIVLTIIVLILSVVIAYFISNHIAKPIKEINNEAKKLSKNQTLRFNKSNILEIDELSETLNLAMKELNKTEELRRDLMANVSHDLKTPLTLIKAYAEMAKDLHKEKPEKQEEDMNTIISESDRLVILVNDILELSRMETIDEKLIIEEFDLVEMINNIIKKYQILEETEKYIFIFSNNTKKCPIKADKKKIEQVIYNLINNAINYTGDDNKVIIKLIKKENIRLEITDTGKGINKEDIPYVWNKYYKNKKKHKRNLIGTGLGLSIVKKILEEHDFNYGVNSIKDKGTTFYFETKNKD